MNEFRRITFCTVLSCGEGQTPRAAIYHQRMILWKYFRQVKEGVAFTHPLSLLCTQWCWSITAHCNCIPRTVFHKIKVIFARVSIKRCQFSRLHEEDDVILCVEDVMETRLVSRYSNSAFSTNCWSPQLRCTASECQSSH